MGIIKTEFKDLFVFEPEVYIDERGYFFESYNNKIWGNSGLNLNFVQDNESHSTYGTLRGLHYQLPPIAQTKLVRVSYGEVLDVVLDLRKEETTFGKTFSIILSGDNKKQVLIPRGFAHGFLCLTNEVIFNYKCDDYYSKEHEASIQALDPELKIDWKLDKASIIQSDKDKNAPSWNNHLAF